MKIERVELRNIKPFAERAFEFADGVNVLSGRNGVGKSTVFEAIGYALFGVQPQSFIGRADRFVRKGQRRGEVRVHFSLEDGSRYVVERHAGSSSRWQLFRWTGETLDVVDTAGADELEAELKKLLGLNLDQPLAEQFLNVVGPLQSDFFGPFVRKGRPRADEFERILGIESWREAYTKSRDVERVAEKRIDTCRARAGALRAQAEGVGEVERDLASARGSLERARAELEVAAAERDIADVKFALLERAGATLQAADQRVLHARNALDKVETQAARVGALLEKARVSEKICGDRLADHQTFASCENELKLLRSRQREAAEIAERLARVETRYAGLDATVRETRETATRRLASLDAEATTARNGLAALESEVERVGAEGRLICDRCDAVERWRERLAPLRREARLRDLCDDRAAQLVDTAAEVEMLAPLVERRASLAAAVAGEPQLHERQREITRDLARLGAERGHLEASSLSLASGDCPLLSEPCQNIGGRPPEELFGERLRAIDSHLAKTREAASSVAGEIAAARAVREELDEVASSASRLAAASGRLETLRTEVAAAADQLRDERAIPPLAAWVEECPDADARERLRSALATYRAVPVDAADPYVLKDRLAAALDALDALETALARHAADTCERLRSEREEISAASLATAARLASARKEIGRIETEIAASHADLARADDLARELSDLATERFEVRSRKGEYAGLDDTIRDFEERLETVRSGHDLYAAHANEARRVDGYSRELDDLLAARGEAAAALDEAAASLDLARRDFDREAYERLEVERLELRVRIGALGDSMRTSDLEIARCERARDELLEVQRTIERIEAEAASYERTLELVKRLRGDVFNRVGERLSDRYRADISVRADRIYRRIAHTDEELRWGDGFRIELVDFAGDEKGRTVERVRYDEELSGGQRMSAVVALRLALLQSTGATIGFFDEPTSNLDAERRARLAEAFRALDENRDGDGRRWYSQLFLVSHDVAFSEITDHTTNLDLPAESS